MKAISAREKWVEKRGWKRKKEKKKERNACLLHIKDDEKNIRGDSVEEDEVPGHRWKTRQPKNHGQKESAVRNRRKSKRARSHPRKTTRERPPSHFPSRQEKDTTPPLNVLNSKIPLSCTSTVKKKKTRNKGKIKIKEEMEQGNERLKKKKKQKKWEEKKIRWYSKIEEIIREIRGMKRKDTFYSWGGGGGAEGMKSREEKKG